MSDSLPRDFHAQTRRFLATLFRDVPPELSIALWFLATKTTLWAGDDGEGADLIEDQRGGSDCYVGVCLHKLERVIEEANRRARAKNPDAKPIEADRTRGFAATAAAMGGFCLDLDVAGAGHNKGNLFATKEEAAAFLAQLPIPPSIVVDTGGGLQAWWVFRELWVFDGEVDRQKAARLSEGWNKFAVEKAKAMGRTIDSTHDLARVMRLPGTWNRKLAEPRPCVMLVESEARYAPGDFERWALRQDSPRHGSGQAGQGAEEPAKAVNGTPRVEMNGHVPAPAGTGRLIVSPGRQPPLMKFADLAQIYPKFRESFKRQRADQPGWSNSEYHYSLAWFGCRDAWPDQDIADTIIAFDADHPSTGDKAMREEYLLKTIQKVRRLVKDGKKESEVCKTAEAATASDFAGTLSAALGIPLSKIIKRGKEEYIYYFQLAGGKEIQIGNVSALLNVDVVRSKVYDATMTVISDMKRMQWHSYAERFSEITETVQYEEGDRIGETWEWISSYIGSSSVASGDNWGGALKARTPFVHQGELHIHVKGLAPHVISVFHEDRKGLIGLLRSNLSECGFKNAKLSARVEGKVETAKYWEIPLDEAMGWVPALQSVDPSSLKMEKPDSDAENEGGGEKT